MKHRILLTLLVALLAPFPVAAFDHGRPDAAPDTGNTGAQEGDVISHDMRVRLGLPVRLPLRRDIREQIHRARHAKRKGIHYPGYATGRTVTTVVNEIQPIVVVAPAAPAEPEVQLEEVKREWVPPVVETVTRPGHWDYAIKRSWMGDHWRYAQDFSEKTWVPAAQEQVVTQEGYWRTVE